MLNVHHEGKLPSLEDTVNALYKGRANISLKGQVTAMEETDWRTRLQDKFDASGRSMRSVSIKAGAGENYLHSILKEGKEPTIGNLSNVCRELGISVAYVLYGVDITPENERLIKLIADADPERREIALKVLRMPGQR